MEHGCCWGGGKKHMTSISSGRVSHSADGCAGRAWLAGEPAAAVEEGGRPCKPPSHPDRKRPETGGPQH